jgi:electron transport complex protein RnfC
MEQIEIYGGRQISMEIPAPGVPIQAVPPPERVILPLSDRPGLFCRPLVERGEMVFKGEKVAEDPQNRMAPIHSPLSGRISDITNYRFSEGGNTLSLFIQSDGKENWRTDLRPTRSFERTDPLELIHIIRDAGVKIIPFETLPASTRDGQRVTPIRHFVVNGIGQGFVGSIARRLVVERSADLLEAVRLIDLIFQPEKVHLVLNRNHTDAILEAEQSGLAQAAEVAAVQVYYPLGHPHLLFKRLFDAEIPMPNGRAIDLGVAFANVDTVLHALEAVKYGKPWVESYLTVSGAVQNPKNLKVWIGTPLSDIIDICGGFDGDPGRLILGNPLSGTAQFSLDRPVLKDTRWVWVQTRHAGVWKKYRACINCGACVEICPVRLMPNFLGRYCEFMRFEEAAESYDLWTCIDCGLCAHVCPSRIPLVQWINYGKRELSLKEKEHESS